MQDHRNNIGSKCMHRTCLFVSCQDNFEHPTCFAWFQALISLSFCLLSVLVFFFLSLSIDCILHIVYTTIFFSSFILCRVGDQRSMSCGVFAMHLCDSFESLFLLPFFKMSKTWKRDKQREQGREQTTKERDTHLIGHCGYLLMQDIGRPHSVKLSMSRFLSLCFILSLSSCSNIFVFPHRHTGIICPLINLLITPWNFICRTHTVKNCDHFDWVTLFFRVVFVLLFPFCNLEILQFYRFFFSCSVSFLLFLHEFETFHLLSYFSISLFNVCLLKPLRYHSSCTLHTLTLALCSIADYFTRTTDTSIQ